jgi:hypothetical protein
VGEVCQGGGVGGRCTYAQWGIVAKSTRAYKDGGGVSFFFAYVLNGRPLIQLYGLSITSKTVDSTDLLHVTLKLKFAVRSAASLEVTHS